MPDNIFDSECVALVNTTNLQGVMGGGLAAQFAQRYPKMYEAYKLECAMGGCHKMGEMLFYHDDSGKIIVNFPTMSYPGMRAKLSDIEDGLKDLRRAILTSQESDFLPTISSIAIPGLGCGIGRLSWGEVAPLIIQYLGDIQGLTVELYPPDAPKYTLVKETR